MPKPDRYRWVILAIVAIANGMVAALVMGLPVIGPALRDTLSLSLSELGVVLAATEAGLSLTPIIWGRLADALGERGVLATGLLGGAAGLFVAASTDGFLALVAALALCGMFIGAGSTASGSAVMGWFGRHERGYALGIRQMSVPIGGALAALTLPIVVAAGGVRAALLTLAAGAVVAALLCLAGVREPPPSTAVAPPGPRPKPLRDRRVWRIAMGGSIVVCAQAGLITFLVVFLHEHRGLSVGSAAAVLASIQVSAAITRIIAGRRSDVAGRRIPPQRVLSWTAGVGFVLAALLVDAPLWLLIPVMVLTGVLVMSGGGLAIATAAELAGRDNAGTAIGLFQTFARFLSAGAGVGFGVLVASTSWSAGYAMLASFCFAGWWILHPLLADEERRIVARDRRLAAAEMGPRL